MQEIKKAMTERSMTGYAIAKATGMSFAQVYRVSRGSSASGVNGLSVARGNGVKVKGGLGALLVIAEENKDDYNIASWKAVVVDGKDIKADTWYRLENGQLVECE